MTFCPRLPNLLNCQSLVTLAGVAWGQLGYNRPSRRDLGGSTMAGNEKIQVTKASGALGGFVHGASLEEVASSDAVYQRVRTLLVEHEVLFFRDQPQDPQVFAAFAKTFGEVLGHPAYTTVDEAPDVQILESTAANPSKIEVWHST